jgi:hypothetical protein
MRDDTITETPPPPDTDSTIKDLFFDRLLTTLELGCCLSDVAETIDSLLSGCGKTWIGELLSAEVPAQEACPTSCRLSSPSLIRFVDLTRQAGLVPDTGAQMHLLLAAYRVLKSARPFPALYETLARLYSEVFDVEKLINLSKQKSFRQAVMELIHDVNKTRDRAVKIALISTPPRSKVYRTLPIALAGTTLFGAHRIMKVNVDGASKQVKTVVGYCDMVSDARDVARTALSDAGASPDAPTLHLDSRVHHWSLVLLDDRQRRIDSVLRGDDSEESEQALRAQGRGVHSSTQDH